MNHPPQQTVPILDFGAQYVQLIARRVREAGVHSVLVPPTITLAQLRTLNPVGIILSGGPASVYEQGAPRCDPSLCPSWASAMACSSPRSSWAAT
jgi:GMP synthase (glutamine-hydrolysing)